MNELFDLINLVIQRITSIQKLLCLEYKCDDDKESVQSKVKIFKKNQFGFFLSQINKNVNYGTNITELIFKHLYQGRATFFHSRTRLVLFEYQGHNL